jgi:uncharacterized protein
MSSMKILAFSDVHSDVQAMRRLARKSADVVVCAGDFTNFGDRTKQMLSLMDRMGKPVFLVHGNHEDPSAVEQACRALKNVHFIHKKAHLHGKYVFIGHGGEGFALESKDFERFARKVRVEKGKKIIFVTHQPAHNTTLDFIWAHHGNKSYRRFIIRKKPALAVCGHLHETAGKTDHIRKTRIVNAGKKGMLLTLY